MNYYTPTILFVMISWTNFLVPMDIVPGRIFILVTMLLVLSGTYNAIQATSLSYMDGFNALSTWMLACIFFVFAELAAFATLLWLHTGYSDCHGRAVRQSRRGKGLNVNKCNNWMLVLFPIFFAVFNWWYWTHFPIQN